MGKHLFARILRASGRLMLFVGAALGFGLTFVHIYLFFYNINHPEHVTQPIIITDETTTTTTASTAAESAGAVATVASNIFFILIAVVLVAIIIHIYNNHMRSLIRRLAKLFNVEIFTVEIASTIIAWTITTLLSIWLIPQASLVAIFAFIINELLFIFAWAAYGQPDYKL